MNTSRARRAVLLAALFISSAAALIYEVSWSRMLALALGGTVGSATLVLMAFMAGLALGSPVWGRLADRASNPARLFSLCQLGVIAGGLASYIIVKSAGQLPLRDLPHALWCAALLAPILVNSFCIGGVYPVMARALIRTRKGIGQGLGVVSAVDALGSAAGGLAAGFVLLGVLGQTVTLALAAALNLGAAGIAWLLPVPAADADQQTDLQRPLKQDSISPILILAAAGVTGLAGMALQVVWIRALKVFLPNTSYSFSLVAGVLILGLAAGGWIYRASAQRISRPLAWLSLALAGSGLYVCASSLALTKLPERILFPLAGNMLSPGSRLFLPPVALALTLIIMPSLASGFVFPLLCSLNSRGLSVLGRGVGAVRLLNAAGSVAGPALAAFLLIPLAGMSRSLQLLALPLLAVAAWAAWQDGGRRARSLRLAVTGALAGAVLTSLIAPRARVLPPSFYQSGARAASVIHYRETVEGTVTVSEDARTGIRACYVNNSGVVGTTYDAIKAVKLLGHLPFLAGSQARDVLVVGFGIGVTAATVASHPGVRRIDCVEIAPGVRDAAKYFAAFNQGVALSPKVSFIADDGRAFLSRTANSYDIISADPTHPTLGCANLYTTEYFRLCRGHLRPGGYICQYLPLHGLTPGEFRGIIKTFSDVFPHASLWLGHSHCVLLGGTSSLAVDFDSFANRVQALDDPLFYKDAYSVAACLMLDSAGVAALAAGAVPCRDDRNYLEFFDPRAKDQANWERNIGLLLGGQGDIASAFPGIDRAVLAGYLAGRADFIAGQELQNQGRWHEAIAFFRAAVAENPANEEYRFLLGQEIQKSGIAQ